MKHLLLFIFCLPLFLFGQEENPPSLYEGVNFTVKNGQEKAFEAAVKAHNEKYHPQGPHYASLIYNINGPFGGQYTWVMGPTNFAALDNRPGEGAHDDDWEKNVMTHVESMDTPGYWSLNRPLSHLVNNPDNTKSVIWVVDIKPGKMTQYQELLGKVKQVYEKERPNEPFAVIQNQFSNTKEGMDIAIIFAFDKWAFLDNQRDFGKSFEAVHGAGSWNNFLNHISECVDGRIDWMRSNVD